MVAQALEESGWEDIVGILEGNSGVLILTENFFFQRLVYSRLRHYLGAEEGYEIVEME